ncbi:unnamed protein product [Boreogadus saida]
MTASGILMCNSVIRRAICCRADLGRRGCVGWQASASGARSAPHLSNISSSPPASTMKEPTLLAVMACDPAVHWGLCDMGHTGNPDPGASGAHPGTREKPSTIPNALPEALSEDSKALPV